MKASSQRDSERLERKLATANKRIARMKIAKKLHRVRRDYRWGSKQLEGALMDAFKIVASRSELP